MLHDEQMHKIENLCQHHKWKIKSNKRNVIEKIPITVNFIKLAEMKKIV